MQATAKVDPSLARIADFLLSSASRIRVTEAIMAERRVSVFKGGHATRALQSPAYSKSRRVPPVTSREDAHKVLQQMQDAGFFVRAHSPNQTRYLQPDMSRTWSDDAMFVWVYTGSQLSTILGAIGLLVLAFALVMYPLWPTRLRLGTWYLMMLGFGLIGLLIAISIVRLIVAGITILVCPPGIWIFPNLFEDVSFVQSFIPVWDWRKGIGSTSSATTAVPANKDD